MAKKLTKKSKIDESRIVIARSAYNGYCDQVGWKSAITGDDLPPFDALHDKVRLGWIAATDRALESLALFVAETQDSAPAQAFGAKAKLKNSR